MDLQRSTLGVLVVEDEFLIAGLVEDMLRELGFTNIHIATTLKHGLSLLVSTAIDLGILDVNIGKDLVFPLAAELKAKNVPIVFATGRAASELPPEWTGFPILPKPMEKSVLMETIRGFGL